MQLRVRRLSVVKVITAIELIDTGVEYLVSNVEHDLFSSETSD